MWAVDMSMMTGDNDQRALAARGDGDGDKDVNED